MCMFCDCGFILSFRSTPTQLRQSIYSSVSDGASCWMYHCRTQNSSRFHAVTIAMNSRSHSALISGDPVSPRLPAVRLRSTSLNVVVIAIDGHTLHAQSIVEDVFCDELQSLINRIPKRDIPLTTGLGTLSRDKRMSIPIITN